MLCLFYTIIFISHGFLQAATGDRGEYSISFAMGTGIGKRKSAFSAIIFNFTNFGTIVLIILNFHAMCIYIKEQIKEKFNFVTEYSPMTSRCKNAAMITYFLS